MRPDVDLCRKCMLRAVRCFGAEATARASTSAGVRRYISSSAVSLPRLSRLFLPARAASQSSVGTSATAENATDLLIRAGYVRKSSAGLFSLLPLGTFVQRKLDAILHRHMSMTGGSEVSLPALLTPNAWRTSGRWENTEIYKLKDASGSLFMLAPTHEEEVTTLVAHEVSSFRHLPVRVYQIGRKYRDERRPRGGMLRGREFVMLDLYSFDSTVEEAMNTYADVRAAYAGIFDAIGIEYVVSEADSGAIGGDLSHEYHYLSNAGEDKLVRCTDCDYAANVEVAVSYPSKTHVYDPDNVAVTYGLQTDGTLLVMYHTPDRTINPNVIKRELPLFDLNITDPLATFAAANDGDMMLRRMIRVFDERVPDKCSLPDLPVTVNIGNITTLRFPCVEVSLETHPHEQCPCCESGTLTSSRAIEVGHTFYLGTKYSKPLGATFKTSAGETQDIFMGCYGIGVSRLVSAIADIARDEHGLSWPVSVAPFEVVVVAKSDSKSAAADEIASTLCQSLRNSGFDAVIDDRAEKSFGWKLNDARLLGFPVNVVVGSKFLKSGVVDVENRRTLERVECMPADVVTTVAAILQSERIHMRCQA
ncbi:uncharacterized protein V1518DRAFT_409887 [Limtongia smithiae]|uniref:uncharacterized protein n=1 Tax=Limtongia smithiae TaxID=1125753 RepID=UPI0034CD6EE7